MTAAVLVASLIGVRPAAAAPTAQQVEAVFLFYFSQFVDWPPGSFAEPSSPIVICVLGSDPFDGTLDQAVAGERVNGRPIAVRRPQSIEGALGCHILYISSSEASQLPRILNTVRGHNVLTVSDMDSFAESGGIVRFELVHEHVQLRINAQAARSAGLVLSSKLLRAAQPADSG
ncbi:MAG TPA: YfiR family protein [Steroidobacteraceae bacterium]|jgi:hypothetical protein|nr:YfiR family protein [Steroidobacteraceae bacterium]